MSNFIILHSIVWLLLQLNSVSTTALQCDWDTAQKKEKSLIHVW